MNTLFDLTGRRSGIVIHQGYPPIICDWTKIYGIPRWFSGDYRGIGEPIPKASGHWYDCLDEWVIGLDVGVRRPPERGWVYQIGGVVIVAPDEWE